MTPTPEELQWALAEASKEALGVAPGWFRAWPSGDEKWSVVNIRAATQVIVNHSREDGRHPNAWTVRALFGGHAVELRVGPYETKAQAILVAHAMLSVGYTPPAVPVSPPPDPPAAGQQAAEATVIHRASSST